MFDLKKLRSKIKEGKELESSFFIAGCDEVGRGPLAGPVVAACVSLHFEEYQEKEFRLLLKEWEIFGVNDSKKLTSQKRLKILSELPFEIIKIQIDQIYTYQYSKNMSLRILIKEISPQVIDQINILNASLQAMKKACIESCDFFKKGLVLIDGNRVFPSESLTVELLPIVKGDSQSLLIGMASIVAKEYRDQLMTKYDEEYPGYYWSENAGYGTKKHLAGIALRGVTDLHRKTFGGVKEHL
jgi:ribonuclease HII